jgi:hypothetical protein
MLARTMPRRLPGLLQAALRVAGCCERNRASLDRGNSALPLTTTLERKFSTSCTLSHTTTGALHTPSPRRYKTVKEVFAHLTPTEDWPRTLVLMKIPPFAIEEDVRELFEESGFPM